MLTLRGHVLTRCAVCTLLLLARSAADTVPVRHIEGVTLGFLTLRDAQGQLLATGSMKQVWSSFGSPVMDDLQFRFKDGSFYEEITKFTQQREFRLVSDQVLQKGPAFKNDRESWLDVAAGTITVQVLGKEGGKPITKHVDLPADVSNGLLFTLVKNIDPKTGTTVSMITVSGRPRLVKLNIHPGEEKIFKVGQDRYRAQHFVIDVKVPGVAGVLAPLTGKKPPTIHIWTAKSEAPTFLEFEGPLTEDSPVWRIDLAAPESSPLR